MEEDWIDRALRDFQDTITCGLYKGLSSLDAESRDRVFEEQARSCVQAYVQLFDIPESLSLDEFLERMQFGGSSKVEITRDGDTIIWDEHHAGECMCPLVKREVVPLDGSLCGCAVHWLRMLVERHTERSVAVELVDSVASGASNCTFRITLGDPR